MEVAAEHDPVAWQAWARAHAVDAPQQSALSFRRRRKAHANDPAQQSTLTLRRRRDWAVAGNAGPEPTERPIGCGNGGKRDSQYVLALKVLGSNGIESIHSRPMKREGSSRRSKRTGSRPFTPSP